MPEIPGFVLTGPPRTKKTSSRIISIPQKGARKCHACGHRPGFPKILPSEAHEEWFKAAMEQMPQIKAELQRRGVELPIAVDVNVEAMFYRERLSGDATGYYQALADLLQAAGILVDDKQISSWDGSRLLKSKDRPRIEVWLSVVEDAGVQMELGVKVI